MSYRGNRYSVPWRVAGLEVLLRESNGELQVHRSGERLAVHPLSTSGSHACVIVTSHHEGIPLGSSLRPGKAKIHVLESARHAPVVQVRSLAAYEQLDFPEGTELLGTLEEVTHE